MKKYYLMAIDKGCTLSMNNLGEYYDRINNTTEMKKYYLMAIKNGNNDSLYNMRNYFSDNLKFYNWLISIDFLNDIINEQINNLNENYHVIYYKEQVLLYENNKKECIVCYENKIHIPFTCGHEICYHCYCIVDRCYYKCDTYII